MKPSFWCKVSSQDNPECVWDFYLDVGSLSLDSWLRVDLRWWQEAQAGQVLLNVSVQLCLSRPQFPVSGAAVGDQGAWRCGPMAERDVPQFGELSRDDLLSDVVLPCQTWKQKGMWWGLLNTAHFKITLNKEDFCISVSNTTQVKKLNKRILTLIGLT